MVMILLLLATVITASIADFDCFDVCQDTYPTHTYPRSDHHWACLRGCRFYVVEKIALNDPFAMMADYDSSSSQCNTSCTDAYKWDSNSRYACQIGCGQTELSGLVTAPAPTATQEPQTAMSLLVEFGPFGLFTSSRDIIVANIQSIWQPVNGNERNWLIMSVFSQDMEPSTTAPTLQMSCQGWLQGHLPRWLFFTFSGLTLLLGLALICCIVKPKKRELSIQADGLPLVKKPAVLGSLSGKNRCVTVV